MNVFSPEVVVFGSLQRGIRRAVETQLCMTLSPPRLLAQHEQVRFVAPGPSPDSSLVGTPEPAPGPLLEDPPGTLAPLAASLSAARAGGW